MVSHVICVIPRMSFGASGKPVETDYPEALWCSWFIRTSEEQSAE